MSVEGFDDDDAGSILLAVEASDNASDESEGDVHDGWYGVLETALATICATLPAAVLSDQVPEGIENLGSLWCAILTLSFCDAVTLIRCVDADFVR